MAKIIENFRDHLTKFAQTVETLNQTFISDNEVDIVINVNSDLFDDLTRTLNSPSGDEKCVISIDNVNFTFLKK
jgi:hypothetical protein